MTDSRRISTGIEGLDEILGGGFFSSGSYLVAGPPGSGKTIWGLQFLRAGAGRGEKCVYVTCAETSASLKRCASSLGWDFGDIAVVDLASEIYAGLPRGEYAVFSPAEVESESIWGLLYHILDEHRPQRLVVDSLTVFRFLATDAYQYRRQLQMLVNRIDAFQCTALLLYDPHELEQDNAPALAADGVIRLHNEVSSSKLVEIRTLEVIKMRNSSYLSGRHAMRITGRGIVVWPHRVEKLKKYNYERMQLCSGIAELDAMLDGGFSSGTCTLISGPAGVGKSTLALQYLVAMAQKGLRGVIYTLEEGTASILERCKGVGIPLERHLEDGSIVIREVNPLEHYPDEFLEELRRDLETGGARIFVLDSLRGFALAMEEFGSLLGILQNLINYVRRQRASLFLVNEQEKVTGDLQVTELGVSYAADNVLLLRYAEAYGRIIRVISCMKKRMGNFEPELREFEITPQGIKVGGKLNRFQGVLTGMPSLLPESSGVDGPHLPENSR